MELRRPQKHRRQAGDQLLAREVVEGRLRGSTSGLIFSIPRLLTVLDIQHHLQRAELLGVGAVLVSEHVSEDSGDLGTVLPRGIGDGSGSRSRVRVSCHFSRATSTLSFATDQAGRDEFSRSLRSVACESAFAHAVRVRLRSFNVEISAAERRRN